MMKRSMIEEVLVLAAAITKNILMLKTARALMVIRKMKMFMKMKRVEDITILNHRKEIMME